MTDLFLPTLGVLDPVMITGSGSVTITNVENVVYINKTVPEATTITLQANPLRGRTVIIKDASGTASLYNLTIQPASGPIDGQSSLIIRTNYASVELQYNGNEWSIL